MDITDIVYRKGLASGCCDKPIYSDSEMCSGCLENSTLILTDPTPFHAWLISEGEAHYEEKADPLTRTPRLSLMATLRNQIIQHQNPQVFDLLQLLDMGEPEYNSETLSRCAAVLLETKHTTSLLDKFKAFKKIK